VLVAGFAVGCSMVSPPYQQPSTPAGGGQPEAAARAPSSASSSGSAQPGQPPPQPAREYKLGPASAALVSQAHTQAAAGNPDLAAATIERALRIEPANPLLWIELGAVHQGAGHYAQADSMAHKALQLAAGDPRAEASAWLLVAESLRARGRTAEASEADARAHALGAR